MRIRFIKIAHAEMDDAVAWYESQLQGLSTQFLDDFDQAIRRIAAYPLANAEIAEGLRRCLLSKFPYGIIYGLEEQTVVVIAVAHLHREPQYWIDRLVDD